MMSQLTRLRDEAQRLLTVYEEHKHSDDESLRRKVHLDLDRFLMDNREVAAMMMVKGLQDEISAIKVEHEFATKKSTPWYKRRLFKFKKGGVVVGDSNTELNQ